MFECGSAFAPVRGEQAVLVSAAAAYTTPERTLPTLVRQKAHMCGAARSLGPCKQTGHAHRFTTSSLSAVNYNVSAQQTAATEIHGIKVTNLPAVNVAPDAASLRSASLLSDIGVAAFASLPLDGQVGTPAASRPSLLGTQLPCTAPPCSSETCPPPSRLQHSTLTLPLAAQHPQPPACSTAPSPSRLQHSTLNLPLAAQHPHPATTHHPSTMALLAASATGVRHGISHAGEMTAATGWAERPGRFAHRH
ncbi:MAG: hypothetical protein WDW36_004827 [Sanguina aurantia]